MLDVKKCLKLKNVAVFASGVLFGTAGIKVLASDDAKKVYTNCTAAVLRAKETVMKARMQRNYILTVSQQVSAQKSA